MNSLPRTLLLLALVASLSLGRAQESKAHPDASAAIEKKDPTGKFQWMHLSFLARAKQPMDILFLGDSITEGWARAPHIWDHFYGTHRPANFGIGGDKTENVIWRIENGELDGVKPKVVVLMLGTNNTAANTSEEIAAADKKIVDMIRAKVPQAKILLLGIFPRGPRKDKAGNVTDDGVAKMKIIREVNAELAKLDDGNHVHYLDIGERFLGDDGKIPTIIMADQLHPNAAGYELWAEAMQPTLEKLMK